MFKYTVLIMDIMCLVIFLIFGLIGSSHSSSQSKSSFWQYQFYFIIGQCIDYRCQANVSTVLTIPCGDYPENDGIVFTYRNDSDNGVVLSTNTTLYYSLNNVTVFDDNTRIACQPSMTGIGEYQYDISVLCKWNYL